MKPAWFCLRSQPKHEHIAAGHLRKMDGLEVFLPQVRFRRKTKKGAAWVTEALFPNYLFAKFDWQTSLKRVRHASGVSNVIHFGNRWPTVPNEIIDELQELFGEREVYVVASEPAVGESVKIVSGALHGLSAIVTQIFPARERVAVLLNFLGRQTALELPLQQVVREKTPREELK